VTGASHNHLADDFACHVQNSRKNPSMMGPTPEDQVLLDEGLVHPQHFCRAITHESWKFIPLRDLDGEVIPYGVRRGISCAIPRDEERSEKTQKFIRDFVERWTNTKEMRAAKKRAELAGED